MKGAKLIKRPASWAKMDMLGTLPVPFIASRFDDGRVELATRDPRREVEVNEKDLCHLCGEPMNEEPSVLLSAPQLSVGIAIEPRGHFDCIGHATSLCPHLVRGGPQIIATCTHVVGVRRPLLRSVNEFVTVLGEVVRLAVVDQGWLTWWQSFEDYDEDEQLGEDYAELARIAMMEAATRRRPKAMQLKPKLQKKEGGRVMPKKIDLVAEFEAVNELLVMFARQAGDTSNDTEAEIRRRYKATPEGQAMFRSLMGLRQDVSDQAQSGRAA